MSKETAEFTAHGYLTICNFGGLEIEINPAGDGLRYRYNFGGDNNDIELDTEIHEAEIIYNPNPEDPAGDFLAGFMIGETFYAIQEFMRIQ